MKILWCLALYDENKQLFDKVIVQMGEDDELNDVQADMAEQLAEMYFSFQDSKEGEDENS